LNSRVCTRVIVPLTRPASEFQLTRSWILKLFDTVVWSDAAKEPKGGSSGTEFRLLERHEYSNRCACYRFLRNWNVGRPHLLYGYFN
jgi:hypothetical protein